MPFARVLSIRRLPPGSAMVGWRSTTRWPRLKAPALSDQGQRERPANIDVALAQAANSVLSGLFPAQRNTFDAAMNLLLGTVTDGAAKTNALSSVERLERHRGAARERRCECLRHYDAAQRWVQCAPPRP